MSNELPEGWASTKFNDLVVELRNGVSPRPNIDPPGVPVLRISAVRPGLVSLQDIRYLPRGDEYLATFGLRDGDLLFTRYNGSLELVGACGLVRGLGGSARLYPDKLMRVRLNQQAVLPEYVEQYFQSPQARAAIAGIAKSSAGQQGISGGDLKDQVVPVAPFAEQRRIVAKVEALLRRVKAARERLEKVPLLLTRFRQAVLAKAFRGELVPTEAELAAREGRSFQSAAELLGQPTDAANEDAPEGWASVVLGHLIDGFQAGRNLTAQGRSAKDGEFGVLKISAVTWGEFRPGENKALFDGDAPRPHEVIKRGDLLITRANTSDLVGAVAIAEDDFPFLMLPDKILRLLPRTNVVEPRFLLHALRSQEAREHFSSNATGTSDSMRNLSQPKLAATPIRLPPLAEQRRIVAKVEALLAAAAKVEAEAERLARQLQRAPQAILQKAFSGELVPTEAELARIEGRTFESAAELLARIGQTAAGAGRATAQRGGGARGDGEQAAPVRRVARAARAR